MGAGNSVQICTQIVFLDISLDLQDYSLKILKHKYSCQDLQWKSVVFYGDREYLIIIIKQLCLIWRIYCFVKFSLIWIETIRYFLNLVMRMIILKEIFTKSNNPLPTKSPD